MKPTLDFSDRLYDSVFGYINLTKIEEEIINTPIFQRLHHIKQLGLANIIFPGAVHTRFSHSLGVMHIMDKIVCSIQRNSNNLYNKEEYQLLRLAALLHDIGHFPFSHIGEKATESYTNDKDSFVQLNEMPNGDSEHGTNNSNVIQMQDFTSSKLHERISKTIVEKWEEICKILEKNNYDKFEIGRTITGTSIKPYHTMLLHSELDADRLDYLLRDSKFLGVTYGNIELDHIVSNIKCGEYKNHPVIGIDEKGLHAVEHFVLARFFWYSQIINQYKMQYLEKLLINIYKFMMNEEDENIVIYNEKDIVSIIESNDYHKFYEFNDNFLMYRMRLLHDTFDKKGSALTTEEYVVNENIKIVLSGQLPKPLILENIVIDKESGKFKNGFKEILREKISVASKDLNIPKEAIVFDIVPTFLSKIHSQYGIDEEPTDQEITESIKLIHSKSNGNAKLIVGEKSSILNKMRTLQLMCLYIAINPLILKKNNIEHDTAKKVLQKHINQDILSLFS